MRTRAIVDLGAIRGNYDHLSGLAGAGSTLMCVVKADAYGHGAAAVSRELELAGARHFAVATLEEAVELRDAGIAGSVALLGGLDPGREREAAAARVDPMIHSLRQLERWNAAGREQGRMLPCHLLFNTGLNRLGLDFDPGDSAATDALHAALADCEAVEVLGVATHYASPENFGLEQTAAQARLFKQHVLALRRFGIVPRFIHSCASAALVHRHADASVCWGCNMARPGLALYGYVLKAVGANPATEGGLRPALEWRARVIGLHEVAEGAPVGYSGSYVAPRAMRVAVLAVGFADGLSRRLAGGGAVMLRGARCPIVGAISMDLTVVDVSAAPGVRGGDEAIVLGSAPYDANGAAALIGGVSYEVLCGISRRVPRQYRRANGR